MTTETKNTWKTLGILSIVFGGLGVILSLFGALGMYAGILGLLLAVGSFVLAGQQGGGKVLAIIGLVVSLLASYWGYNMMVAWNEAGEQFKNQLENVDWEKEINEVIEE